MVVPCSRRKLSGMDISSGIRSIDTVAVRQGLQGGRPGAETPRVEYHEDEAAQRGELGAEEAREELAEEEEELGTLGTLVMEEERAKGWESAGVEEEDEHARLSSVANVLLTVLEKERVSMGGVLSFLGGKGLWFSTGVIIIVGVVELGGWSGGSEQELAGTELLGPSEPLLDGGSELLELELV